MMVEMVDPDLGDPIFDPAAGTGGFLIDAVEYILAKYSAESRRVPIYGEEWPGESDRGAEGLAARPMVPEGTRQEDSRLELLERAIYGFDVSRQMMLIAMMNLVLHGIRKAQVKRANSLSEMGGLTEDDLRRRYKVILSNPPFSGILP